MGIRTSNSMKNSIPGRFELDKHFKNQNKDSVQPFKITTAAGNTVEGFINLERNERFGQLIIEKVNDRNQPQTIWGIQKIHYPYVGSAAGPVRLPEGKLHFREKFDGSNICLYPIKENGKIIDVEYKTRRLPMASMSSAFINGDDLVGFLKEKYPQLEDMVRDTGYTISLELFGKENPHMVSYDEKMGAKMLVAMDNNNGGQLVDYAEFQNLSEKYGVPAVEEHLIIDEENDRTTLTPYFQKKYKYTGFEKRVYKDRGNLYRDVQRIYESINKRDAGIYGEEHFSLEGSVIFVEGTDGRNTLWKCKAPSIEEYHMRLSQLNTVPDASLEKAVSKTIENLTIYELADREKAIAFLRDELAEELPLPTLDRNIIRIGNAIEKASRMAADAVGLRTSNIDLNGTPRDVMPQLKKANPKFDDGYLYQIWKMAKKIS